MKHRLAIVTAAATVAILSGTSGCTDAARPHHGSAGTSAAGATNLASSGNGASGAAGSSASAASGGTSASPGTAGAGVSGSNGGASLGSSSIPSTFETVKLVLEGGGPIMPCAAAPCHGLHGAAPPIDPLELPPNDDPRLYANLITYVSRACHGAKLVEPGQPAQSALLRILRGPCGTTPRMPYGCTEEDGNCIPDEYIAAIEQWILNGAPQR